MPFIKLYCNYCGHKWDEYLYSIEAAENSRCPECKDTHPVEWTKKDVYGYEYEPKRQSREKKNVFGY